MNNIIYYESCPQLFFKRASNIVTIQNRQSISPYYRLRRPRTPAHHGAWWCSRDHLNRYPDTQLAGDMPHSPVAQVPSASGGVPEVPRPACLTSHPNPHASLVATRKTPATTPGPLTGRARSLIRPDLTRWSVLQRRFMRFRQPRPPSCSFLHLV